MSTVVKNEAPLIAPRPALGDRCDRCTGQARVTWIFESGSLLMLCNHHSSVNLSLLLVQSVGYSRNDDLA